MERLDVSGKNILPTCRTLLYLPPAACPRNLIIARRYRALDPADKPRGVGDLKYFVCIPRLALPTSRPSL